jgi:hypothetical protein
MTADHDPALIAAAAQAVEQGMAVSEAYHEAAGRAPGQGLQVALPSWPDPRTGLRPQGLGFDIPDDAPALRQPERLKLVPDYSASLIVGSPAATAARSDGWPAGTSITVLPSARASSVVFASASSQPTWRSRLREAWSVLTGR